MFPDTRPSLVQRLVGGDDPDDWRQFFKDYWGPICRFAQSQASLSRVDAEDVASLTFECIFRKQLLGQWTHNRSARLRTVLCAVTRKIISNRLRIQSSRRRNLMELKIEANASLDEEPDLFYRAWVEDLLQRIVTDLFDECAANNQGDYFRVLHGKICEGMTMPEISEALCIPLATVENYFKAMRKRIAEKLKIQVRQHVERYGTVESFQDDWSLEWDRLGDYLKAHGGLEAAINESLAGRAIKQEQSETVVRMVKAIEESGMDESFSHSKFSSD